MRVSISQSLRRDFLCTGVARPQVTSGVHSAGHRGAVAGVGAGVSRDSGDSGQDICCSGPVSRGRAAVLHPPSPLHPLFRLHLSVSHRSLIQQHQFITTTETAEPPVATAAAAVRWVNESDFQQSLEAAVLASKAEDQIQF